MKINLKYFCPNVVLVYVSTTKTTPIQNVTKHTGNHHLKNDSKIIFTNAANIT